MTTACWPMAARTSRYSSSSRSQVVATSIVSTNAPSRNTPDIRYDTA
jgi:hypothetical protein